MTAVPPRETIRPARTSASWTRPAAPAVSATRIDFALAASLRGALRPSSAAAASRPARSSRRRGSWCRRPASSCRRRRRRAAAGVVVPPPGVGRAAARRGAAAGGRRDGDRLRGRAGVAGVVGHGQADLVGAGLREGVRRRGAAAARRVVAPGPRALRADAGGRIRRLRLEGHEVADRDGGRRRRDRGGRGRAVEDDAVAGGVGEVRLLRRAALVRAGRGCRGWPRRRRARTPTRARRAPGSRPSRSRRCS